MLTLEWHTPTPALYNKWLELCPRSNLLASFEYAYAMRQVRQLAPKFCVIKRDNKEIGFFQSLEASTLFRFIHAFTLDRGPLWIDGHGSKEDWFDVFNALDANAPARFGRQRRFMPEMEEHTKYTGITKQNSWKKRGNKAHYQTIYLDLRPDADTLLKNMKPNWRNALKKAQSSDIKYAMDNDFVQPFLQKYLEDRMTRKYPGPSIPFLTHLMDAAHKNNTLRLLTAEHKGELVAAIAVFIHGKAATYQTAWTSRLGRSVNATNGLLWHAIERLKTEGIEHFDLGGINNDTAEGVTQFKLGMGGQKTTMIGQFG